MPASYRGQLRKRHTELSNVSLHTPATKEELARLHRRLDRQASIENGLRARSIKEEFASHPASSGTPLEPAPLGLTRAERNDVRRKVDAAHEHRSLIERLLRRK